MQADGEQLGVDLSTPVGDETVVIGTPGGDAVDGSGDGIVLDPAQVDPDQEGFLCQDAEGDGTCEVGIDEDADGILEENEVLGTLEDNEVVTEDEEETLPRDTGDEETEEGGTQGICSAA